MSRGGVGDGKIVGKGCKGQLREERRRGERCGGRKKKTNRGGGRRVDE